MKKFSKRDRGYRVNRKLFHLSVFFFHSIFVAISQFQWDLSVSVSLSHRLGMEKDDEKVIVEIK